MAWFLDWNFCCSTRPSTRLGIVADASSTPVAGDHGSYSGVVSSRRCISSSECFLEVLLVLEERLSSVRPEHPLVFVFKALRTFVPFCMLYLSLLLLTFFAWKKAAAAGAAPRDVVAAFAGSSFGWNRLLVVSNYHYNTKLLTFRSLKLWLRTPPASPSWDACKIEQPNVRGIAG